MKELAEKFRLMEIEISAEKGPFVLFGLFLPEEAPGVWDLLVAAPWIEGGKEEALRYISGRVTASLSQDELLRLSRIIILEPKDPAIAALQAVHVEHGVAEVENCNFSGLEIRHAYLITVRWGDQEPQSRGERHASAAPAEPTVPT